MEGWITVKNNKSLKKTAKMEQRHKWKDLKTAYPHIITPQKARILQQDLNIDGLADGFDSEEWVNLQCEGWMYVRIVKAGKKLPLPDDSTEYKYIDINNRWQDKVLFKKVVEQPTLNKADF